MNVCVNVCGQAPSSRPAQVCGLAVAHSDRTLLAGDSLGFVYVFNIEGYCWNGPPAERGPPALLSTWRAHIERLLSLDFAEEHRALITSSIDCTVRLWTLEGHFIGTCGQPTPWNLYSPTSFQHPMVPYDVLVDPASLPAESTEAPQATEGTDTQDTEGGREGLLHVLRSPLPTAAAAAAKPADETCRDKEPIEPLLKPAVQQFQVDDETIAQQIRQKSYSSGRGTAFHVIILDTN